MKSSQYWTEFWKEHGRNTKDSAEQIQVLRTFNKKPIDKKLWLETLQYIESKLEPTVSDHVLDLCCGNGLISRHLARTCSKVTSVDVSEDLVTSLSDQPIINPVVEDIRHVKFNDQTFTKVLIYAGIQYLDYSESVKLLHF